MATIIANPCSIRKCIMQVKCATTKAVLLAWAGCCKGSTSCMSCIQTSHGFVHAPLSRARQTSSKHRIYSSSTTCAARASVDAACQHVPLRWRRRPLPLAPASAPVHSCKVSVHDICLYVRVGSDVVDAQACFINLPILHQQASNTCVSRELAQAHVRRSPRPSKRTDGLH